MKTIFFKNTILIIFSIAITQICSGQYGTLKFCPNTPAWNNNKSLVSDQKGMYENYAKGPDGCWWIKTAKHASYKEGFYQLDMIGTKYYYNSKKKVWENAKRNACVLSPFG